MYKLAGILTILIFALSAPLLADIRGTDNNGNPVILRDDGTWNYIQSGGTGGATSGAIGNNLILNGGFEQGSAGNNITAGITHWTVISENVDVVEAYWQQIEGNRSVDLAGTYGSGAIQQSFNSIPGNRYQLSFFMAGNPSCDNPAKEMRVSAAGQSADFNFNTQGRSRGQMGWQQAGWSFVANGTQTNLVFESTGPNRGCGIALDDVSVVLGSSGSGLSAPGGGTAGGPGNLNNALGLPCAPTSAFVTSLYQTILDRQPEPAGLNNWIGELNSGKSKAWVISRFFKSQEYRGFGKSNIDFVRDAYQGILGREPEMAGRSHWIRRLSQNLSRDTMIQHFLNSPEYTSIMARCGTSGGGAGSGTGTGTGAGASGATGGNITWDFETGNTNGWVKTGTAFDAQPTFGDNPTARGRGQPSNHSGNYWIGTYEMYQGQASETPGNVQGDAPTGMMTSNVFTIPSGSVNFLVGGGNRVELKVELLVAGNSVLSVSGQNTETMRRVTWDLTPWAGQRGQIRLVDNSSGGWGHINADDFRFENPPAGGSAGTGGSTTTAPGGKTGAIGTQQQAPGSGSATPPPGAQFTVFTAPQTGLEDVDVYEYAYLNWNNANWGGVTNMSLASNSSGVPDTRRRIYIRFDPATLGTPLSPNARVELALTAAGGSGEGNVEARVYAVTSSWQEGSGTYHSGQSEPNAAPGTISWSNQPSFNTSRAWATRMISSASATYLFDISDLVRAWRSGQLQNYGLVIVGASEGSGRYKYVFHSSEQSDPLWRPKILVTGAGTQAPVVSPPSSGTPTAQPSGQPGTTAGYLTCRNNDNEENGCGPHLSAHTYRFAPSTSDRIVDIMWDTGSGIDCRSELRIESGEGNSWGIYGDFTVNSSQNGNEVAPSTLDIVLLAGTDAVRISDHNTCYIDDSSIRFR